MAWQVHGTDIREVTDKPASGRFLQPGAEPFPKSDGLVTSSRGRALTLLTADCLPVAIAAADGSRLALLHAGWRGIEAGVIEAGVAAGGRRGGGRDRAGGRAVLLRGGRGRGRPADARASGRTSSATAAPTCGCAPSARFAQAGSSRWRWPGECTICTEDRYFSHRRDHGVTGRQGVVGVLA